MTNETKCKKCRKKYTGETVIAVQRATESMAYLYGIGKRFEAHVPIKEICGGEYGDKTIKNPVIILEKPTPGFVYGFECWHVKIEQKERIIGNRSVEYVNPPHSKPLHKRLTSDQNQ